tara:strand:- start:43400 stop:43897 length:498 start_codon:yes stop_codon:yes gene_type:complete
VDNAKHRAYDDFMTKRYTTKQLPLYAHLPGETPHPKKSGGHSEGLPDPVAQQINDGNWHTHEDYLYAVDLFNLKFYWESHVWWEAVWKACPQGPDRDFIQGMIKVAAAALKSRMNEIDIARDHALRGHELMAAKFVSKSRAFGVSAHWWKTIQTKHNELLELSFE